MEWPKLAVERVRPSRFVPPFCPWQKCEAHRGPHPRFHRHGYYDRKSDAARIPRYRCLACCRTCSRQTFSTTYYLKRRELPAPIAAGLVACSAHRQLARSLGCAKTTVTRAAERLSRHALLLQSRALHHVERLTEPIVHDHFEAFIHRQDQAVGIGTAVGARSWFVFDLDPAPHRGAGRRPDRTGSARLEFRQEFAYARSIGRTLGRLAPLVTQDAPIRFVADGRKAYRIAHARHPEGKRFVLETYKNPKRGPKGTPRSADAIARDFAMFPADQLHQMYRHTCADHKRETIAFGRRLESVLGRSFLMAVWKNFIKGRSERRPDRRTPAMMLGLSDKRWSWEQVLRQRLFPTRAQVPHSWITLYRRAWSRGLPRHTARHAY